MDIQFVMLDGKFVHECHCNNREGFVYFPEIDIRNRPPDPTEEKLRGSDRGCREPAWFMSMTCEADHFCTNSIASLDGCTA